jgi:dihydrofolate reductase
VAELIYSAITSLDGYVADVNGNFDWGVPSEEVHAFVNEQERPIGLYLYGRRMYEVMVAWESDDLFEHGDSPAMRDYAQIWRAAAKIVFSRTLTRVSSEWTGIETTFDPEKIRETKQEAGAPISIGGPHLAAEALRAGLVDELRLIVAPVAIGDGKPAIARDLWLNLELTDERSFANDMVFLRYRVAHD